MSQEDRRSASGNASPAIPAESASGNAMATALATCVRGMGMSVRIDPRLEADEARE